MSSALVVVLFFLYEMHSLSPGVWGIGRAEVSSLAPKSGLVTDAALCWRYGIGQVNAAKLGSSLMSACLLTVFVSTFIDMSVRVFRASNLPLSRSRIPPCSGRDAISIQ